jgi:hypothetical protein
MERFKKFSMFIVIFTVFTLLMSLGVTLLWNVGLSPVIDGVNDISYSQSVGLLSLILVIKLTIENISKINANHII